MMFRKNKPLDITAYFSGTNGNFDLRTSPWLNQMWPSPMIDSVPSWFSEQKARRPETGLQHTIRACPSFINTMKIGHVLKTPAEMIVKGGMDQDGKLFAEVSSPLNFGSWHDEALFADNFPYPDKVVRSSFKISSPFLYRVNRPSNLIILPCWWDKENKNITAIQGMIRLSPDVDVAFHIHTFIRQPSFNDEYVIPFGTPIAQILVVDIPEAEYDYDQSLYDDDKAKYSLTTASMRDMMGRKRKITDHIKSFLMKEKNEN